MLGNIKTKLSNIADFPAQYLQDTGELGNKHTYYEKCIIFTVPTRLVGRRIFKMHQRLKRENTNWSFKYFDNFEQQSYMKNNWSNAKIYEIFMKSKFGQMKADIFRYCYLYEFGGIYIDATKIPVLTFDQLFTNKDAFNISFESRLINDCLRENETADFPIAQYCLCTPKNSELLHCLIKCIEEKYPLISRQIFENPREAIFNYTGPIALKRAYDMVKNQVKCDRFHYMSIDYHNAIKFSYPGSGYFKRKTQDYSTVRNEIICE